MLFPLIVVKDVETGEEHIVGTNSHDVLFLENGKIQYYNLQDGGATPCDFKFKGVKNPDDDNFDFEVKMVTFEELQEIYKKHEERERQYQKELDKINRLKLRLYKYKEHKNDNR